MIERHIEVRRTARYYELEPESEADQVWVACHGYRQRGDRFAPRLEPLRAAGRWVVVPEALNRFYLDEEAGRHGPESRVGATWMTRDDRLTDIADYVFYLDRLLERVTEQHGRPASVVALGFSQGAATVARWAVQGSQRVDALVAWGSPLPPDLDLPAAAGRLAGRPVLLVTGARDAAFPPGAAHAERERLVGAGLDARVLEYAGGHRVEADALRRVDAELASTR